MPQTWQDKVVLVTGASGVLGRAIARAFALRGARLILTGRRLDPLQTAAQQMRALGHDAVALPADLTSQAEVEVLFDEIHARYERLDVLVNNAGRSTRKAVLDTTPEDFRELWEVNFLAAVRCTRAGAAALEASRGHLVNIGSLAGKSAARYLGAYPASKFALSAYTQQLRLELGPQGVHVLLVCSGPIARKEVRTYGAEAMPQLPESARQPGGGVKARAIEPEWLAEKIVESCERRRPELVVPAKARLLFALMQLSPRLGDYLVRKLT